MLERYLTVSLLAARMLETSENTKWNPSHKSILLSQHKWPSQKGNILKHAPLEQLLLAWCSCCCSKTEAGMNSTAEVCKWLAVKKHKTLPSCCHAIGLAISREAIQSWFLVSYTTFCPAFPVAHKKHDSYCEGHKLQHSNLLDLCMYMCANACLQYSTHTYKGLMPSSGLFWSF